MKKMKVMERMSFERKKRGSISCGLIGFEFFFQKNKVL